MVTHLLLVAVRIAIVIVGLVLTYLSYEAYRRNRSRRPLLALSIAFLLITLGAVIQGVLFEFFDYGLTQVNTIDSSITATGFAIVLLAILAMKK